MISFHGVFSPIKSWGTEIVWVPFCVFWVLCLEVRIHEGFSGGISAELGVFRD